MRARVRPDLLVFACAITARLVYFLVDRQSFVHEGWDLAGQILSSGTLASDGAPTTSFEPLYPLFLALSRAVMGDRPVAVQLVQIAIASAGPVCLYHLTDALAGRRRVALVAGLLLACDPLSIRHAAYGQTVALAATLLVAFCLAFVRSRSTSGAVVAGLLLGLSVLTRTMALPLVALATLVWVRAGRWREALALAVTALTVFAPFAIRNYGLNGAWLPTRSGINLFVSTSEYTAALVPEHHPDLLVPHAMAMLARSGMAAEPLASPRQERREDAMLTRLAWENVKRQPLDQLWLRVKYVGYFFSPFLVPGRREFPAAEADLHLGPGGRVTITNDGRLHPWWVRALYTASFTPVLGLAVLGAVHRRQHLRPDAIVWSVLATFVAVHAVFFPGSFYRVPMAFVLMFFAAAGADALWRRVAA